MLLRRRLNGQVIDLIFLRLTFCFRLTDEDDMQKKETESQMEEKLSKIICELQGISKMQAQCSAR